MRPGVWLHVYQMKMGTDATPYLPYLKGESCVPGSGVNWMKMGTDTTHF